MIFFCTLIEDVLKISELKNSTDLPLDEVGCSDFYKYYTGQIEVQLFINIGELRDNENPFFITKLSLCIPETTDEAFLLTRLLIIFQSGKMNFDSIK